MLPNKKILLITSGQPSLNPRLIKEADALTAAGFNVTVLYSYWNDWGTKFDKQLIPSKQWDAIRAGGDPLEKSFTYFLSRIIHKVAKLIVQRIGPVNSLAEIAIARGSYFLIKTAKKHKADLYIGHNLGALAATVKAAKMYQQPCGFDAEDFHRFEVSDDKNNSDVLLKTYLENKYIPQVNYLTASSPQISDAYQQHYPHKNPVTILNVFPKNSQLIPRTVNSNNTIRLFWFSQTIGNNRGIDDVIKALQILNNDCFEFHLLGNATAGIKNEFSNAMLNTPSKLYFHDPISPDDLITFASQFDIGLALEPGFNINNNLALSNKLFTYLQAGLAVIVSNTTAQKLFIKENPTVGKIYPIANGQALAAILSTYQLDRKLLFNTNIASSTLGSEKLNWENEKLKFLAVAEKTLNSR